MANLWIESWQGFSTADASKKYNAVTGGMSAFQTHPTNGPRGSGCNNGGAVTKLVPVTGTVAIIGTRFYFDAQQRGIYFILTDTYGIQLGLRVEVNGALSIQTDNNTIDASSPAGTLPNAGWYYIEFVVTVHPSAGTYDVYVNNVLVPSLSATGYNTARSSGTAVWAAVQLWGRSADTYVNDGSGSAPDNTRWGETRVDSHYPNANGNSSQWTRSTGADQYATIDETTPNDDTDYNYTDTADEVDTVGVESLKDTGAETIRGVQLNLCMRKEQEGTCLVAPVIRPASSDIVGSDLGPTGVSYSVFTTRYPKNPNGDVAWTESAFNATEFGYKRTE